VPVEKLSFKAKKAMDAEKLKNLKKKRLEDQKKIVTKDGVVEFDSVREI
jgi:hypothetical protein